MSENKRKSVKVLLLNENNELLLLRCVDKSVTSIDGKQITPLWFLPGGKIEKNETIQEAAIREIQEETGIIEPELKLGPVIWHGELDLIIAGKEVNLDETFIVARTTEAKISPAALSEWEKQAITNIEWFSLERVQNCQEPVYPAILKNRPTKRSSLANTPTYPEEIDLSSS